MVPEPMVNGQANPPGEQNGGEPKPWLFGIRPDTREIAVLGGIASGASRRLKDERRHEADILDNGRNYWAKWKVLEDRRRRDAELARARLQADRDLVEADYALMDARAQLEEAHEQLRQLDEQLAERERARRDDDALTALVRSVGPERLERVVTELGWYDADEVSA